MLCECLIYHQAVTSEYEPSHSVYRVGVVNTRDAKLHHLQTRYSRATGAPKVRAPVFIIGFLDFIVTQIMIRVVAAAQGYFDKLEQACRDKQLILLKLILSPDVRDCYRHYGRSLAEEVCLRVTPAVITGISG